MSGTPFRPTPDGLAVSLRVTPRAARNRIDGHTDGEPSAIRVAVTTPPADGKANQAVIKLLAKAWKLPKSSLSVVKGASGRRKTILVAGDPSVLETRLRAWLDAL